MAAPPASGGSDGGMVTVGDPCAGGHAASIYIDAAASPLPRRRPISPTPPRPRFHRFSGGAQPISPHPRLAPQLLLSGDCKMEDLWRHWSGEPPWWPRYRKKPGVAVERPWLGIHFCAVSERLQPRFWSVGRMKAKRVLSGWTSRF
jgi:hypothetical protein